MRSINEIIDIGNRVFAPGRPNGGWGIPPGWGNIVYKLVQQLESLDCPPRCAQMKEKFGGLRFYVDWPEDTPLIDVAVGNSLIGFAEQLSYITCSECGAPGHNRSKNGWYTVLCDECVNG